MKSLIRKYISYSLTSHKFKAFFQDKLFSEAPFLKPSKPIGAIRTIVAKFLDFNRRKTIEFKTL